LRIGAVTGSLVLHTALIAAAFTLPAPERVRTQDPVTVDLFSRPTPKEQPPPPKLTPPLPTPEPPKVAMRERSRESAPVENPTPQPKMEQPEATPPPSSDTRPPGKVDLTLHTLPTGPDSAVSVPPGTGTFGDTLGTGGKKPWKMRGDAGNPLTGKVADEAEERFPLRAIGGGEYEFKGKAFHARIARDGRVSFDDKSIRDFKGLSGGFDITDMVMRAKGNDPYRAEKQAFMNQTEAMRKKMAQSALRERVAASLANLPAHLASIWHDTRQSAAERRRTLYETWKDGAESDNNVDAGQNACEIVETFVRRYLPEGSPDAYSEEELAMLNRGQKKKFQPYR
jgi:hypothetical protein